MMFYALTHLRHPISKRLRIILGVSLVVVLALGYHLISCHQHAINPDDTTLPMFSQFGPAILKIITPQGSFEPEVWLWIDFKATMERLLTGISIACMISVILGLAMGCYEWVEAIFAPTVNALTNVVATAMIAVFFVLVGTGDAMLITMVAFGVTPTLTKAIYLSAKYDVPLEMINKSYTLGGSNMEVMWLYAFREILPKVLESIRLQIGPSLVYLIAAEYNNAQVGFGYRIRIQQRLLHMDTVYLYVIILAILGYSLSTGVTLLRKWWCPWFERSK